MNLKLICVLLLAPASFAQSTRSNIFEVIPTTGTGSGPGAVGEVQFRDKQVSPHHISLSPPDSISANQVFRLPGATAVGCVQDDGTGTWTISSCGAAAVVNGFQVTGKTAVGPPVTTVGWQAWYNPSDHSTNWLSYDNANALSAINVSASAVSFTAGGSINAANSGSDGTLFRASTISQNLAGTKGGYVHLTPVTYNPYDSLIQCIDIFGNVVTQPLPLTGDSFSPDDAVLWVSTSPLMPPSACGAPIGNNPLIGLNLNSYFLAMGGLATTATDYNSIDSLLGGIHVKLGVTAEQAVYLKNQTTGTLNTPAAGFGAVAHQSGTIYLLWDDVASAWKTADLHALPLVGGTMTGPIQVTGSNDFGTVGFPWHEGWFTLLNSSGTIQSQASGAAIGFQIANGLGTPFQVDGNGNVSALGDLNLTSSGSFLKMNGVVIINAVGSIQSPITGSSIAFQTVNTNFQVDGNGNVSAFGQFNATGPSSAYKMGGTTVIDASRNATFATLSCSGSPCGAAAVVNGFQVTGKTAVGPPVTTVGWQAWYNPSDHSTNWLSYDNANALSAINVSASAVSFTAGGSINAANSGSDGTLFRASTISQNLAGTKGGYVHLTPVTYNPYDSLIQCIDIFGNVVTQPLPLTGDSFSPDDAVLWVSTSPLMPPSACGAPIGNNPLIGLNLNSYFLAMGGLATTATDYNSIDSLLGGIHVKLGVTAEQAVYLKNQTTGTLNTPAAGFGAVAHQSGTIYLLWDDVASAWKTADLHALPLVGGTMTGPIQVTGSNDFGTVGFPWHEGWFTLLNSSGTIQSQASGAAIGFQIANGLGTPFQVDGNGNVSALGDLNLTSSGSFLKMNGVVIINAVGSIQSPITGSSIAFQTVNTNFQVDGNGNVSAFGQFNATGPSSAYKMGGTTVIDASRNATFATLSCSGSPCGSGGSVANGFFVTGQTTVNPPSTAVGLQVYHDPGSHTSFIKSYNASSTPTTIDLTGPTNHNQAATFLGGINLNSTPNITAAFSGAPINITGSNSTNGNIVLNPGPVTNNASVHISQALGTEPGLIIDGFNGSTLTSAFEIRDGGHVTARFRVEASNNPTQGTPPAITGCANCVHTANLLPTQDAVFDVGSRSLRYGTYRGFAAELGLVPIDVPPGTIAQIATQGSAFYVADGYANGIPSFLGRNANGTYASPSSTISGGVLFSLSGRGYVSGLGFTTSGSAAISMLANENWGFSNNGADIYFETVAAGSNGRVKRAVVTATGINPVSDNTGSLGTTGPCAPNINGGVGPCRWNDAHFVTATIGTLNVTSCPACGGVSLSGNNTWTGFNTYQTTATFNSGISIASSIFGNVTGGLVPTAGSTYDLGTSSLPWSHVYAGSGIFNGLNVSTIIVAPGGVLGQTCSGPPTASFATSAGIVTHC